VGSYGLDFSRTGQRLYQVPVVMNVSLNARNFTVNTVAALAGFSSFDLDPPVFVATLTLKCINNKFNGMNNLSFRELEYVN
jgi:hypothetical protein